MIISSKDTLDFPFIRPFDCSFSFTVARRLVEKFVPNLGGGKNLVFTGLKKRNSAK